MQSRATMSGRPSPVSFRRVVCIALAAAAVPSAVASHAIAARPIKGAGYEWERDVSGGTSAVSFWVSRRGTTVKDPFILLMNVPCANGRSGFASLLDDPPWRLAISRDGSFSGTYGVSPRWLDPFAASEEYSLSGSFTRGGRAARLVLRVRQVGEGGTVCDTGDRRIIARRSRRS